MEMYLFVFALRTSCATGCSCGRGVWPWDDEWLLSRFELICFLVFVSPFDTTTIHIQQMTKKRSTKKKSNAGAKCKTGSSANQDQELAESAQSRASNFDDLPTALQQQLGTRFRCEQRPGS